MESPDVEEASDEGPAPNGTIWAPIASFCTGTVNFRVLTRFPESPGGRRMNRRMVGIFLGGALALGVDALLAEVRVEDVGFVSGSISLAGRLILPESEGPYPALVFTHGSGDASRDNGRYRLEAEYLADHGVASLLFDKRGSGDSTGDWRSSTFEDLADDALAAVAFLKTRTEIDGSQIGLRGSSQSGWILPIAADRSRDVAHLILISPAGVSPYDQIVYDVRTDLEDAGFGGKDVDDALALLRSGLDYARAGLGWATHEKALEAAREKAWFAIASGPPIADHWMWSWIRPMIDFDVVPILERISIPVLVLLGDEDRECPSQIAGWVHERALGHRPEGVQAIRYFPGADHGLRVPSKRVGEQEPPLAEGYLEAVRVWILDQVDR